MIGRLPIELNETTIPFIIGIIIFNLFLYRFIYKKTTGKRKNGNF